MPVLNLVEYVFPVVTCRANPQCPDRTEDIKPPSVRIANRIAVSDQDENIYRLTLDIVFGDNNSVSSYTGEVRVVGLFIVNQAVQNKEAVVLLNGSSVLYSAAREFILSITSRGPNIPCMLPQVRFRTIKKKQEIASRETDCGS